VTGIYHINAATRFDATGAYTFALGVGINATTTPNYQTSGAKPSDANAYQSAVIAMDLSLTANDVLTLWAVQSSGSAINSDASGAVTWLSVHQVSA